MESEHGGQPNTSDKGFEKLYDFFKSALSGPLGLGGLARKGEQETDEAETRSDTSTE